MIALAAAGVALLIALLTEREETAAPRHTEEAAARTSLPDTLRAVTLYGPTSYFTYRDQAMGLDYEMLSRFAADKKMVLQLEVARTIPEMLDMLRKGKVDLIAYEVPRIAQYRKDLTFCGKKNVTRQVLVQSKADRITDVTQLVGRTVFVEKDSRYQYRLQNLNDELGGGMGIEAVVSDTLETADLVAMVANGELPLTVTDSDLAEMCAEVMKDIDVSMPVSFEQFSSWAVAKNDTVLSAALDDWAKSTDVETKYLDVHKKYFEHIAESALAGHTGDYSGADRTGHSPSGNLRAPSPRSDGSISSYDHIFRKYAPEIGWDWRHIAAIAYTESKFNPSITSWAGAKGLMQLMPSTARTYGVADRMNDPDASVYGATRLLRDLDKSLQSRVSDPAERRKFVVASYNSGLGHILDAIALAKKYGRNPQVWYGNVREMALLKTKPQYYNDPVVKHGYFRGQETVEFVDRVYSAYSHFSSH